MVSSSAQNHNVCAQPKVPDQVMKAMIELQTKAQSSQLTAALAFQLNPELQPERAFFGPVRGSWAPFGSFVALLGPMGSSSYVVVAN